MDDSRLAATLMPTVDSERLQAATVTSLNGDYTVNVTLGDTLIPNVRYNAAVCPHVGDGVWLRARGLDRWIDSVIAPNGPMYVMAQAEAAEIAANTSVTRDFTTPALLNDPWGVHSGNSFIVPLPGRYLVEAFTAWEANATGQRSTRVLVNGAFRAFVRQTNCGTETCDQVVTRALTLARGDVVTVQVRHSATAAIDATAGGAMPTFAMTYLGPASEVVSLTTLAATSGSIEVGTLGAGSYASTAALDGTNWHINEVTGTPGFDIRLNFTLQNSTYAPSQLKLNGIYLGSPSHIVDVQVYNGVTSAWDTLGIWQSTATSVELSFDSMTTEHIVAGALQVRLYHESPGNANHDQYIDYAAVVQRVVD